MIELDIEYLIKELAVREKAELLSGVDRWHTVPVERLNIPSIRVSDGPNGLRGTRSYPGVKSACFPCGTSLGATWNKKLINETGKLMAVEAKHKSAHVILGPTVNIQRSPLGGRGFESFSEDPVLSGLIASEIINGIQSEKVMACLKHFVCNDMEDDRQGVNINITERTLREIYLAPFALAIKLSNPKSIMTSYSKVNGTHVSQERKLLIDLLKDEYKYDGTIMSDWYGTYDLRESISNGLDLEMPGPPKIRFPQQVTIQVANRELHIDNLNDRVRGVLRLVNEAIKSGIPFNGPEHTNNTKETAEKLRECSSEGIVLLKNENNVLPLSPYEKIAIIGPNSKNSSIHGGGSASVNFYYSITPFEGICEKLDYTPDYTVGCYAHKTLPPLGPQLIREDGSKGYQSVVYLEPSTSKERTVIDECDSERSFIRLPDYTNERIPESGIFYIDFDGYFIPDENGEYEFGVTVVGTAQIFIDNQLIVDNKTKQTKGTSFYNTGTIEEKGRIYMRKGQKYKVKIEFGSGPTSDLLDSNDSLSDGGGCITFGAARVINDIDEISKAVEIAKNNDKVVLVVGLSFEWESEGHDRAHMDLPGYTYKLIDAVSKANKNTIVVNQSGTPVTLPFIDNVSAIVQQWFSGNEGGNALADILFGDVNPSGKLPLTFPKAIQDNPAFLNYKSDRGQVLYGEGVFVGYRYYEFVKKETAFPFGFGLSYSSFEFSDFKLMKGKELLKISLSVKNTSKVSGKETVQVYVSQNNPSVTRPVKELKDFAKVNVDAGTTKTVELEVDLKLATSFWDEYANKWISEKGTYKVLVGNSSDNILLDGSFEVDETTYYLGL